MKLGKSFQIGSGMRKLLLASALLASPLAHSQTVIMNNDPTATGQCMGSGGYLPPAHFTYSGPGTVATWVTNVGSAFSQVGGTGPYTYGCYPNQFTGYYFVTNGAGSATTTANFYGQATVYALNSSGCVMAQKTITIYPAGIELTGQVTGPGSDIYQSGSFNMGGTWATNASYYNWAISYSNTGDDYTIISGQGTNHVTIAPQPWAPFNVNVVMNGYFQPAGDPCSYDYPYGRANAQRAPFASYDNSSNYLCSGSQMHVNVYDHAGTNYPSTPGNGNYRHFTYQWYKNGSAISGATNKDYDPNSNGSGSYYCTVSQYKWNGSSWAYETQKNSNTISVIAENAGSISYIAMNTLNMNNVTPYLLPCDAMMVRPYYSGTPVSYSFAIYENTGMFSLQIYNSGTIAGSPGTIDIHNYVSSFDNTSYVVNYTINYGCTTTYGSGLWAVHLPDVNSANFTVNGATGTSSSPVVAYDCAPINFQQTATGTASKYSLQFLVGGTSVYNSGVISNVPSTSAIDLRSAVAANFNSNTGYNYFDPTQNHSGVIEVKYGLFNGCSWFYQSTFVNLTKSFVPDAGFTVNSAALNNSTALDLFNCNAITFAPTSANAYPSYQIDILDASTNAVLYSTTMVNATPASIDLRNLCTLAGSTTGCNYLDPANHHTGNFKIQYTVFNGCTNDVKTGLINVIAPPPADATFTINSSATSPTTPVNALNCNTIQFGDNPTGVQSYKIEILQSGVSLYNSGTIAGAPAATLDLRNLCAISSATGCSTLSSATGIFEIRYTTFNGCVYDVKSGLVNVIAPPSSNATFTVNGSAVNSTTAVDVYNCNPIVFANAMTSGMQGYQIEILNGGVSIYNSGMLTGATPSGIDLRNLCTSVSSNANCDYLTTHTGTYQIRYTVNNGCVNDVKIGLINVIAPTTTIALQTNTQKLPTYSAVNYLPSSNNPAAPDTVGRYSTIFLLNGSYTNSTICSYEYSLEKYDIGTASWITVGPVTSVSTSCSTAVTQSINMSVLGPNPAYMFNPANAPNNTLWRLKVNLQNNCGPNYQYAVFVINDTKYLKHASEEGVIETANADKVQFAPVPFKNSVSATITLSEVSKVSMKVYTIDGRMVHEVKETEMQAGQQFQTIPTDTWASGVYFYQCTIGKDVFTGKIVKE